MQALQRLVQKNINMEVILQPINIEIKGSELNEGRECKLLVRIERGPVTWQTNESYRVFPEDTEIVISDEEFKKRSGFYFTKDGAEFKKATIKVIMIAD